MPFPGAYDVTSIHWDDLLRGFNWLQEAFHAKLLKRWFAKVEYTLTFANTSCVNVSLFAESHLKIHETAHAQ
jgi:hypothetical protein